MWFALFDLHYANRIIIFAIPETAISFMPEVNAI